MFNYLQLSLLASNQIMVIKHGMETTRMAKPARQAYKKAVGLSARATHLEVLFSLGATFKMNGYENRFFDKVEKLGATHLITREQLTAAYPDVTAPITESQKVTA